MNTEGGKTLADLRKEVGDGSLFTSSNPTTKAGLIFHDDTEYKNVPIRTDAVGPVVSIEADTTAHEKVVNLADKTPFPVILEEEEMTGELSYLDVAGLAAPNNNLLVRIPDSCYMKGNMRLVSPMITGFLPVALVGPTADLLFTDVDGNTRPVEIGDYVMLEEMNYPTIALGKERYWDIKGKKGEPFKNTYMIIGSHQVLVVKGNPNRVVPVDNIAPCCEDKE